MYAGDQCELAKKPAAIPDWVTKVRYVAPIDRNNAALYCIPTRATSYLFNSSERTFNSSFDALGGMSADLLVYVRHYLEPHKRCSLPLTVHVFGHSWTLGLEILRSSLAVLCVVALMEWMIARSRLGS